MIHLLIVRELIGGLSFGARRHSDAGLKRARAGLATVETAIRQGVVMATTKRMQEDAEAETARLETEASRSVVTVVMLPFVIEQMRRDLRATLPAETRRLGSATLRRLLGEIPLRREG